MTTEIERAWVAGFMDGEACITIHKQRIRQTEKYTYQATIRVVNTNYAALVRVRDLFGAGKIYKMNRTERGIRQITWQYVIVSKQAMAGLEQVLPYLLVKKKDAERLLELAALGSVAYRRGGMSKEEVQAREDLFQSIRKRPYTKRVKPSSP